jgi:serine acetyltransferase
MRTTRRDMAPAARGCASLGPLPQRRNPPISSLILLIHSLGRWTLGQPRPLRLALWPAYRAFDLIFVKLLAGADIPAGCSLGAGVVFAHGGKGVVISDQATIGDRVTIYHQVTIPNGVHVEDDVWIAPGAKIAANVTIGRDSKIGPNSFVDADVPPLSVAVGVPASFRSRKSQK